MRKGGLAKDAGKVSDKERKKTKQHCFGDGAHFDIPEIKKRKTNKLKGSGGAKGKM